MTNYDAPPPPPPPPVGGYPQYPAIHYPAPRRETRSLSGTAIAIQVLLALQAIGSVGLIVASLHQQSLLDRIRQSPGSVSLGEARDADSVVDALNVGSAVLYLATAVVWIVWLYRARRNVEAWHAPFQRWAPGLAIGAWFIPLFNLVGPAIITKDIADGTDADPTDLSGRRWPQPLVLWWGIAFAIMVVMSTVDSRLGSNLADSDTTLDDVDFSVAWSIATEAVTIVTIGLAVALVRSLTRRQQKRMATSPAA